MEEFYNSAAVEFCNLKRKVNQCRVLSEKIGRLLEEVVNYIFELDASVDEARAVLEALNLKIDNFLQQHNYPRSSSDYDPLMLVNLEMRKEFQSRLGESTAPTAASMESK
jgi:hypothetical protein